MQYERDDVLVLGESLPSQNYQFRSLLVRERDSLPRLHETGTHECEHGSQGSTPQDRSLVGQLSEDERVVVDRLLERVQQLRVQ